jgi:hypothetical protein
MTNVAIERRGLERGYEVQSYTPDLRCYGENVELKANQKKTESRRQGKTNRNFGA